MMFLLHFFPIGGFVIGIEADDDYLTIYLGIFGITIVRTDIEDDTDG
jgi:hypothetical protein